MSLDELMKVLQQEYINSLPEKIALIEKQVQAADVTSLRDSFHKLKGTGTTYGLPEVSELGELIEDLCVRNPTAAAQGASQAVSILRDIHLARANSQPYDCAKDPRLIGIQKLLQNSTAAN